MKAQVLVSYKSEICISGRPTPYDKMKARVQVKLKSKLVIYLTTFGKNLKSSITFSETKGNVIKHFNNIMLFLQFLMHKLCAQF